jgi:tetratricopeptide (TPR) repeat protein
LAPSLLPTAVADYNKVIELETGGKINHTPVIKQQIFPTVKNMVVNHAVALNKAQNFKEASQAFSLAYELDKTDGAILYNAAAASVNGQDYDNALKYYLELDRTGFTGEGTNYSATNKDSKEIEGFPNQQTMDLSVKTGKYINPKAEKLPSLKGDIVKNIALIYAHNGQTDKAIQAMGNARKANPNDTGLIIAEAELYLKTNDMVNYKRLIAEAAQKSPNDATLFYNLGVVSATADPVEAEKYYKKAVELKPDYFDALVNLGVLAIRDEKKIVDEMNKLGNTAKDNQRYDVLKKQREGLYTAAIPYLEKAHKIKPDDEYVISVLAGMYQGVERMDDYKAMKAKLKKA